MIKKSCVEVCTIDGKVSLSSKNDPLIDRFFGPGYMFVSSNAMASDVSNACLIITKRNNNRGRLYQVETPKAFKLIHDEIGIVADESNSFLTQEHETNEARRICNCRHFSFLCHELGLPCSASVLITAFVRHQPFFIFAEPGDLWIDICLSTPVRTYVLTRKEISTGNQPKDNSDTLQSLFGNLGLYKC